MRWLMLVMVAAMAVQAETIWNAQNKFGKLGEPQRMKVENTGELLVFTDIERDCGLTILEAALDPSQMNAFVYTYRAEGTGDTTGELFYARANERFADAHRWGLPPLNGDGQWHTVTVTSGNVRNKEDWFKGGVVESLRLDLTNSAGGRIELKEFKFVQVAEPPAKPKPQPKTPPVMTTEKPIWSAENKFAGIAWTRYAHVEYTDSSLLVYIDNADPQVMIQPVELEPAKCNTLIYKYRARGVGEGTGQLYFGLENEGIMAERFWELPKMTSDGQWHTVILNYKNIRDAYEWFKNGGTVTQLRLDPTDSNGGFFELAELRFEYRKENDRPVFKMPRLPKVEPVLDTEVWPAVTPNYTPLVLPTVEGKKYFQGKMIASHEDKKGLGKYVSFYLRKVFTLPSKPVDAWLQFTADDTASAYVNGIKVAFHDNWRTAFCKNVTEQLDAGRNVLGFNYSNGDTWGGVIAELYVKFADGTCQYVNTDEEFVSVGEAPENWCKAEYDAKDWVAVKSYPPPPNPPWRSELAYVDFNTPVWLEKAVLEPKSVTAGEKTRFTIDFKGPLPKLPFDAKIVLRHEGARVWDEKIIFTEKEVTSTGDNTWRLVFYYETPLYFSSMDVTIALEGPQFYCIGTGYPTDKLYLQGRKVVPGYEKKPSFKVTNIAGSPAFALNGKPFYPMWGAVGIGNRADRLPIHNAKHTPNLVTVYTYDVPWQHLDQVVPQVYDQSAELYRRHNSDAYFMVNIPFYPPKNEFTETYPEDMCLNDEGNVNQDGRICYSFASKRVLRMFEEYLDKVLGYLESAPYANRIVGYRLVGGHTIEWLGWDPKPGRTLDFSPVCKEAFKAYLQKNHPEITDYSIPTMEERTELDDDDILWDPVKHAKVIAFNNFYSENITDIVIDLCKRARKIIGPDKVLGTYHGYTMTLGASGTSQLRAHYDFKRFLEAGCIDFIMSPQPYGVRNIGDPMGDMKPFTSIAANNVIPVIEDDTRTSNARPGLGYCQTPNKVLSLSVIARNFGAVLCRNTPTYFYSLSAGTEFDFPEAGDLMEATQRIGQHCLETGVPRKAEIAVVVSETAIKAMPALFGKGAATGEMYQYYKDEGTVTTIRRGGCIYMTDTLQTNYIKYACMGAPIDYILAEDLPDHLGDYKLYIFSNCIVYDDKFLAAVEARRQRECTLFWMYAPGFTYGNTNSVENMKRLTGITLAKAEKPVLPAVTFADGKVMGTRTMRLTPTFHALDGEPLGKYENGTVGLAKVKTGSATSYFSGVWQFDVPFLMELAKGAGVHLFSETMDPVEANGALVTLHARHSGRKTIRLPKKCDVLDVYNNKIVATDAESFTFDAPLHSSYLFYYGSDAKRLLK